MTLAPGARLGSYQILGPLGAGGMGEVYRARDTKLGREVAVKVLPAHLAEDADALARFEREAKAVAALSHPHILAIHDFGRQEGTAYAVMELLEGETLRQRLSAGPLPERRAVEFGVQIAQGLAAAHDKGIVHRDLKPENLFLTRDGHVKVVDFGLVRQIGPVGGGDTAESPTRTKGTEPGIVLGSAGYMSPEQVRGQPADHRSDIFSLGAVLYEMLAGRRAFRAGSPVETMSAILKEEPAPLRETGEGVPPDLERIVSHCLEKRPEDRFQSMRDLAFDLASVGGGTGGARARITAGAENGRRRVVLIAAGALLLTAAAAFEAGRRSAPRPEESAPRPASFTQLTDQPGVEAGPKLSPDGKSFVYVGNAAGNADVYFQRVGGGKPINLTPDSPADDQQPAFSPDGERMAFRSEREGGGIFVMGSTGESVKRLTDFGYDPSWSPDGKEIVVSSAVVASPTDRNSRGALWVVDVATGAKRLVAEGDAVQPSWSPHGRRIAYWGLRGGGGQRDLFTAAADGSESRGGVAATEDVAVDWNPVWSSDGRHLYFSSTRGGTMNLWRMLVDEASGRPLGPPEPLTTPSSWSGSISVSRDGSRLVFAALEWRSSLLKAPFDPGAEKLRGPSVRVLASTQHIRDHEFSPDGEWVAFTREGSREDLFVMRADGTSYRALTEDLFRDRGPAWSPDGRSISFYSDRSGTYEIWLIHPDGSGLRQVTHSGASLIFPTWSPDGSRFAASSIQPAASWYVVDGVRAGQEAKARPMPGLREGVGFWPRSWSRDGDSLAGSSVGWQGTMLGLVSYSLAGGKFDELVDNPSRNWLAAAWLSDGRRLVFRDRDGIKLFDTRSRRSALLIPVSGLMVGKSLGVTRDDRWITFTETATEGDVWLMTLD